MTRKKPHNNIERVAVLRNDELKENLVIEYQYDTRTLSTSATRDVIEGSGSAYGSNSADVEEYHNVDIGMFDKLVKDFTGRYGFRIENDGFMELPLYYELEGY